MAKDEASPIVSELESFARLIHTSDFRIMKKFFKFRTQSEILDGV
jgi:hypothetical protein